MRAIVPFQSGLGGTSKAPTFSLRVIKKTSAANALGQQKQEPRHEREKTRAPLRVEFASRNDTSRHDPFWDRPRLIPAFVAQLLGQVMPERREKTMVETTYGRAGSPRMALLVDRKS
jgi:hypothetical protein